MVDFAKPQDYEDIAKVWRISFSDTDSYIKQFWDSMFKPENTIVYREQGVVVAMYFFLESQTVIKGRGYSTLYLYAAATLPKYRGRGYMAELIEKGVEVAKQRKVDFITLVPADDYLFDYYVIKLIFFFAESSKIKLALMWILSGINSLKCAVPSQETFFIKAKASSLRVDKTSKNFEIFSSISEMLGETE